MRQWRQLLETMEELAKVSILGFVAKGKQILQRFHDVFLRENDRCSKMSLRKEFATEFAPLLLNTLRSYYRSFPKMRMPENPFHETTFRITFDCNTKANFFSLLGLMEPRNLSVDMCRVLTCSDLASALGSSHWCFARFIYDHVDYFQAYNVRVGSLEEQKLTAFAKRINLRDFSHEVHFSGRSTYLSEFVKLELVMMDVETGGWAREAFVYPREASLPKPVGEFERFDFDVAMEAARPKLEGPKTWYMNMDIFGHVYIRDWKIKFEEAEEVLKDIEEWETVDFSDNGNNISNVALLEPMKIELPYGPCVSGVGSPVLPERIEERVRCIVPGFDN